MTVLYRGDDVKDVEDYVLNHIAYELDAQQALTGAVIKTLYVGEQGKFASVPSENEQTSSSDSVGLAAGIAAAAAVLVVLLASFVVVRKRKRSTPVNDKAVIIGDLDVERAGTGSTAGVPSSEEGITIIPEVNLVPAYPDSPDRSVVSRAKSIGSSTTILMSNKTNQKETEESCDSSTDAGSTASTDAISDISSVSEVAVRAITPPRPDTPVSTPTRDEKTSTTPTRDEKSVSSASVSSGSVSSASPDRQKAENDLPPLPPTGPSAKPPPGAVAVSSKTMKRRRKKKKKGKQKIVRVNSRENMKGMETITESVEEDGGDDDEDGSEYSWSTDGESDAEPNSREPSPARSDSRSVSPQEFCSPDRSQSP